MGFILDSTIENDGWVKGDPTNPKGITLTVTTTDAGDGMQSNTVAVAGAGTSGLTTTQLLNSIEEIWWNGATTEAHLGTGNGLEVEGTTAVIAIVKFKQGWVVTSYAAGASLA